MVVAILSNNLNTNTMKKFYISSEHELHEDHYEEGELSKLVNSYTMEEIITAKDWREAVDEYFGNTLFLDFKLEFAYLEENRIQYNSLVDSENMDATEDHIREWKQGRKVLYNNHSIVTVNELSAVRLA